MALEEEGAKLCIEITSLDKRDNISINQKTFVVLLDGGGIRNMLTCWITHDHITSMPYCACEMLEKIRSGGLKKTGSQTFVIGVG